MANYDNLDQLVDNNAQNTDDTPIPVDRTFEKLTLGIASVFGYLWVGIPLAAFFSLMISEQLYNTGMLFIISIGLFGLIAPTLYIAAYKHCKLAPRRAAFFALTGAGLSFLFVNTTVGILGTIVGVILLVRKPFEDTPDDSSNIN